MRNKLIKNLICDQYHWEESNVTHEFTHSIGNEYHFRVIHHNGLQSKIVTLKVQADVKDLYEDKTHDDPTKPDMRRAPKDATHWAPESDGWVEAWYKFEDGKWYIVNTYWEDMSRGWGGGESELLRDENELIDFERFSLTGYLVSV